MTQTYQANWDSLLKTTVPEWMLDAKFGLYAHWGLYAVPAFGNEWYAKHMYNPEHDIHKEHIKRFGSLSEFGYKDFIPSFTAEHFDASAWADLWQASGAQYGGFSLAHHDGYGLWDSDVYSWNVGKMGPKRDLYGEFTTALRQRALRVVAPFHIVRGFDWFLPGWYQYEKNVDSAAVEQGKREGWDLFDPKYKDFYWNSEVGADYAEFLNLWVAKVTEVIDKYQPDLMWFDGGKFRDSPYEPHTLDILSHYFNRSLEWGKDVTVLNKMPINLIYNFPEDFGVLNFEAGRSRKGETLRPWNDDLKIGDPSWGYVENQSYLSGKEILHNLIDRVSRGGSLMLSICPKADGTIPEAQQQALEDMGAWLSIYGEAIYATRAWKVHGEGDDSRFVDEAASHAMWDLSACTPEDKRYTQSKDGNILYAFTLGKPEGQVVFEALGKDKGWLERPIASVSLLKGSEVVWKHSGSALTIDLDSQSTSELATVWKITLA